MGPSTSTIYSEASGEGGTVAFEVRVNGQPVHLEEGQVTAVSVQSARGELYRAGISTEGVIDVVLDVVPSGGPRRLDQIEAEGVRYDQARVAGQPSGNMRDSGDAVDRSFLQTQHAQNDTLRPGGPSEQIARLGNVAPPSVDLAQGLDPRDEATLSARVEAFNSTGDAQRAVDENPPNSDIGATAEQGGSPTDEANREAQRRATDPTPEEALPEQPNMPSSEGTPGPTSEGGTGEFPIGTENVQTPPSQVVPPPESTPEGNREAQQAAASGTTTPDQRSESPAAGGDGFNLDVGNTPPDTGQTAPNPNPATSEGGQPTS
jgi:hypothetical protein